ncbi:MAG: hypothetical protein AAFR21_06050 [Pseudomonadota bacterium]
MFSLLFPKTIDNTYRGQWLALIFFVPVLLIKLMMGFNMGGFNPTIDVRSILQDVDGVPLDTYSASAVTDLLFFTNAWGLGLFTIGLVGVIALVRYRAMIPLAILLLTVEQGGRKAMSVAENGLGLGPDMSAADTVNWVLTIALLLALILSVIRRG